MSDHTTIIIAGSRTITEHEPVSDALKASPWWPEFDEIVTGGADGVDATAKELAEGLIGVEHAEFPADWSEHGKAAGPIRNAEMADYADGLVAVWDGESAGTRDMIEKAFDAGIDVYVRVVDDE